MERGDPFGSHVATLRASPPGRLRDRGSLVSVSRPLAPFDAQENRMQIPRSLVIPTLAAWILAWLPANAGAL